MGKNFVILLICVFCIFIGYVIRVLLDKAIKRKNVIGTIIVDKLNPHINGGIYTIWDIDPQTLNDGDVILLDIMVANIASEFQNSQESQGL